MLETLDIALARQPIFDREDRLVAYELLYRDRPPENRVVDIHGASSTRMSSDTITRTFIGMGLGRVTGGKRAFVNVDRRMLLDGSVGVLDPRNVVLELLESVVCDGETVAACEALVGRGYTLALDDFEYAPSYDPLLRLATIVKLDVLDRPDDELRQALERVRPFGVRCLAERVETAGVHRRCAALGFELFQGYFYARPEMLSGREVPVQQANLIRLLNLLRDPDTTDERIEDVFRGDLPLAYKLLRIVNSAGVGASLGRSGVDSIAHAIRLLGRGVLHRWLALLLVSSFATPNGVRGELVTAAMQRARMCELLAETTGRRRDAGALFMAGLFSLLDALMRAPMAEVIDRLDLAPELRGALLEREGPYAPTLRLVEAFEGGRWDDVTRAADALPLSLTELSELYARAVEWARERAAEGAAGGTGERAA
jgi:EAL and modified HD-GYP domain-containing signal transduction protein